MFRAWSTSEDVRDEIYGIQFSERQTLLLEYIWASLKPGLNSAKEEEQLAESLFQLSCLFWVDMSTTSNTSYLLLVYFLGVLGIHLYSLAYCTAYLYTSVLASLVWIRRLLLLKYALPTWKY